MNLNPKLEAVRKHSSDSGTSVEDSTTNSNSVIANSASGGQIASRPSNCDSGLGTPVSLLDEMAVSATTSSSLAGSSTGHNSSQGSAGAGQLSKWRSSMSGKTTAETLCSRNFQNVKLRLDFVEISSFYRHSNFE